MGFLDKMVKEQSGYMSSEDKQINKIHKKMVASGKRQRALEKSGKESWSSLFK